LFLYAEYAPYKTDSIFLVPIYVALFFYFLLSYSSAVCRLDKPT